MVRAAVGKTPFSGSTEALRAAHAGAAVPPLPEELGVPDEVALRPEKLLEKDPQRRYASAEDLIRAIDQAQPRAEGPRAFSLRAKVAGAVVVLLAAWSMWPMLRGPTSPPAVRDLIIEVVDPQGRPGRTGTMGSTVFRATEGDEATIRADLTSPGYAYLIAFLPDGRMELCAPEDESARPDRDSSPTYPPAGKSKSVFGFHDGTGLQVFAVVLSHSRLPAFKNWKVTAGPPPWRTVRDVDSGVVWWSDGRTIDTFQAGKKIDDRNTGYRSRGARGAVADLAEWLKGLPDVDAVQVKAFAVVLPNS